MFKLITILKNTCMHYYILFIYKKKESLLSNVYPIKMVRADISYDLFFVFFLRQSSARYQLWFFCDTDFCPLKSRPPN